MDEKDLEQKNEELETANVNADQPTNELKNDNIVSEKELKKSKTIKYLTAGGVGLLLGAIMFSPSSDITKKASDYPKVTSELTTAKTTIESLEKENEDLKAKVEEAAPWFELSEKQRDEQILLQAKQDNAKYLSLVDSGKSYYNMTKEERALMDEWLNKNYTESVQQLKDAYKDKFDMATKDKESSLSKIEAEEKAAEEKKKKEEEEAKKKAEAEKYNTGLTWEKIAREGMIGTLCQFKGNVVQVMKGDGYVQCRVATKGNYDNIMLIEIHDIDKTILEGDSITFKGMSMGTIEYTTVLGAELSIPAVLVDEYTIK